MSDGLKPGLIILIIIFIGWIVVTYFRDILPFVDSSEYYEYTTKIDKNISYTVIHTHDCPLRRNSWFKFKHSKYDFILEADTYICRECFSIEEAKKMLMVHNYNLKDLHHRYRIAYSQEEADSLIKMYNCDANLREVYFLE